MGNSELQKLKHPDGRWDLQALATKALRNYSLEVDYPPEVERQVQELVSQLRPAGGEQRHPDDAKKSWVQDFRHIPFVSVDNGTLWSQHPPESLAKDPESNVSSRDIDQLQWAEEVEDGIRVWVAVSDVDAFVEKGSVIDQFMDRNTSSVYTPDKVFNLIPPVLAEDLVSLNPREDRIATVVNFVVHEKGQISDGTVQSGLVHSQAKLDYPSVGSWLEGKSEPSPAMLALGEKGLSNLRLQLKASQALDQAQQRQGAIEFDTTEMRIITELGNAITLRESQDNVATEMVENFMVTANRVVSEFLRSKGFTTLERVVTPPARWDKIVDLVSREGTKLPATPDARALSEFLRKKKKESPDTIEDLSLSIIKLIGKGVYRAVPANEATPGHFPLGVKNYMQSTASIRRGGDRVSPRLLKAALAGKESPYSDEELSAFAENLNTKSSSLKKAERMADKMVVATMLYGKIGQVFEAVVTGVKKTKYWCRIKEPPIEGSLYSDKKHDIGDKVQVTLTKLDVLKGWIDFQES